MRRLPLRPRQIRKLSASTKSQNRILSVQSFPVGFDFGPYVSELLQKLQFTYFLLFSSKSKDSTRRGLPMRVQSRDSKASEHSEPPRPKPEQPEEEEQEEESGLDRTIADSFPASDPPSSIPDPDEED